LRKAGYDIIRYADMPSRPPNVLKLVVDARVAAGQRVFVLQVGANDGVGGDPVRDIVVRHHLPGILVEPLPDLFAKLQANYDGHPGICFEQCAVGEHDGEGTIYRVSLNPELPRWLQGLASFDKNHLTGRKHGFPGLEKHVEAVRVPILSLGSLLQKHKAAAVDLLQIDTEGYDCRIVQAAIKLGLRPAIIHYEFRHISPREQAACKRSLAEQGYSFIDVGWDTLAVLQG
jgi:FkbM family methyltransferase